jgi:protein-ribulosamine 3-kinase
MSSSFQTFVSQLLNISIKVIQPVGGGCISQTYKIDTSAGRFFCKINSATKFPQLLEKEKNGLHLLKTQNTIRVPTVITSAVNDGQQLLVLEWIEEGGRSIQFWKNFGEQLAALHHITTDQFGLEENNYMGSVSQQNSWQGNWNSFFITQRLQPLVQLCQHYLDAKALNQFEVLYRRLPEIFNDEKPSLLHGDLWSGNFMCDNNSFPVLIDPAVYFGHRSVDLAMATLFGGFDPAFFQSYHYHFPLPSNHQEQWKVCNLYPLLIHLHLFGKSYLRQILYTLEEFV